MDSELLEKEYNELQYSLDVETAEKFRKFVEGFRTNLGNLGRFRFCDVNLDDLENVYKFLKSKKLKFKKL